MDLWSWILNLLWRVILSCICSSLSSIAALTSSQSKNCRLLDCKGRFLVVYFDSANYNKCVTKVAKAPLVVLLMLMNFQTTSKNVMITYDFLSIPRANFGKRFQMCFLSRKVASTQRPKFRGGDITCDGQ